ncbi:MAG: hypothetical protein NTW28_15985 [Candidatus Solibacter sp.]|nr:hypothetical protein [Candidatus Solibacter sp.]
MADGLIAATGLEQGLVVVTRNVRDYEGLGVIRPSGPADRDDDTLPVMTWEDAYQALKRLPIGTPIPKVDSTREYKIKQWSYRDGEERLSYTVANKSIPVSWIRGCFEELRSTRFYHGKDLGGCNFTTIGGLFVLIGIAERAGAGFYVSI